MVRKASKAVITLGVDPRYMTIAIHADVHVSVDDIVIMFHDPCTFFC